MSVTPFTRGVLSLVLLVSLFPVGVHAQPHLPTTLQANSPSCLPALKNQGFEDGFFGPADWNSDAWNGNGSSASLSWDADQHHAGSKSVKISLATLNDARWIQTIAVEPQTDYSLSGWIKTDQVAHSPESTDAGANLSLFGTWTRSVGLFGTNDWTYVTLPFNSGGEVQVTIGARVGYWAGTTTGTAWFDDLCVTKAGVLNNPSFEEGAINLPASWEANSVRGPTTLSWDATTVHSGAYSVRVAATGPSIARWTQTIAVSPDSEYELTGWIKTVDVQGAGGAALSVAAVQDSALAAVTSELRNTQDWTQMSIRFITGQATSAVVACTLGLQVPYREVESSGTMWCDDLTLTKLRSLTRTTQSGRHVNLDVYADDWSFTDPTTYIARLDEVYDALADLVGASPYNGQSITARSDATMVPGLLAGNPIRVAPGINWAMLVNRDGIDFGLPHELGHDFDFAPRVGYYNGEQNFDNGEHWANFKALYAFDQLSPRYPTLKIGLPWNQGQPVLVGQLGQRFIDERGAKNWIDQGRTDYQDMSNDVYTGLLYKLVQRLGWAPFKCVFRQYSILSTPVPTTDEGKVELWANTLSNCAGVDVTPDFRSWGFPVQRTMVNTLANPSFELDANNDGSPDSWTTNNRATRSSVLVHSGSYSMRHSATNNANYTISQTIANPTATQYQVAGWVNIPSTSDTFSFKIQVEWRDTRNRVIRTDTVKTYSAATSGWNEAAATVTKPAGATSVSVAMVVSSLSATIYIDDMALRW